MMLHDFDLKNKEKRILSKEEDIELGRCKKEKDAAIKKLSANKNISEEEKQKLEQAVADGKLAEEILFRFHMGLVHDRARKFKTMFPGGPEYEDLVQSGMIGLMNGVHKYDPDKGNKFSTMAYYWIWQSMGRETNKTGRLVRIPENRIGEYMKMMSIMSEEGMQDKTQEEKDQIVMERLNWSRNTLREICSAASIHASLNRKIGNNGSDETRELMDVVGQEHCSVSSEANAMDNETKRMIWDVLDELDPLKKDIVVSAFNLSESKDFTSEHVCEKWNINKPKFKRLQKIAVSEMGVKFKDKNINFIDFVS